MSNTINIRKGLDIRLLGDATKEIKDLSVSKTVSLSPLDFHGLIPKLAVKEGEPVKVGDVIFHDKKK
jgi:Na+-transporting NADH:ubiquinone oxidoreductase subunit A